jgi:hypothetical protein
LGLVDPFLWVHGGRIARATDKLAKVPRWDSNPNWMDFEAEKEIGR